MKHIIYIFAFAFLLAAAASCGKDEPAAMATENGAKPGGQGTDVPEGYFVATFTSDASRVAVEGTDTRIQHLRHIIFAENGDFVKERVIDIDTGGQEWPIKAIYDTLPLGSYNAVFLGNVDNSLFTYAGEFNVLTGYEEGYASARINLPPVEFTANTEYYMAEAEFSNSEPSSQILLQRIISRLDVFRNTIDPNDALDMLVGNIVDNIIAGDVLTTSIEGLLSTPVRALLSSLGLNDATLFLLYGANGLDQVVNIVIDGLVAPLLEVLRPLLVDYLTGTVIENLLEANSAGDAGFLELLTPLLNPWESTDFQSVVVTINNFPRAIDFGRNVHNEDVYAGEHQFAFSIPSGSAYTQKVVPIKCFADPGGVWDIQKVNVVADNYLILDGVVVDGLVDGVLLNDVVVDIGDPLSEAPGIDDVHQGINELYIADYSIADLGLNDYTQNSGDGTTIDLSLGKAANLDDITENLEKIPIIGTIVGLLGNLVLDPLINGLLDIEITVPIQLPLVGISNLSVSGSWSAVEPE